MQISVLSAEEVEAIHQASLRILSETGIRLKHPQGRELLAGAGASVLPERVRLPPDLVERALAGCPHQVKLRGRGGSVAAIGDGNLYVHNLGGARDIYEPASGGRRPATRQDVRDSARLLDALDQVNTITPFCTPQDAPGALMSLAMYREALPYTTKPVQGPGVQTAAEVGYVAELASVIGPPDEVLSLGISPVSPLLFPDEVVAAILETARRGIPLGPLPCPTAGTTAPFSLAGAIAQQNAEVLASIVLAQLVRPGLPVIYCGRLAMMEPRTGISVWGGVELGLASAATVQAGQRYGLPVNVYGFATNAQTLDIQSGWERALNAAIPALAGADELSGVGELAAGVMGSYAQMVCDNEIVASLRRLQRGIQVDEQALGVEVIAAVLDGPGNFLGQKHTREALKAGEMAFTRLAERGSWETWERGGRAGMAERAQAEAERLLVEHEVPPLAEEQQSELDKIMQAAQRELGE